MFSMGNIGHTQGLAPLVSAFERSDRMKEAGTKLVITGNGVAAPDVAREVRSAGCRCWAWWTMSGWKRSFAPPRWRS